MNLKEELKKRLFDDMIKKVKEKEDYVVMVVSPHTSKILSSCARMYDVMESGVIVLENITRGREPLPEMPALYFLEPTDENLTYVIQDFSSYKKPQYKSAYLFFTTSVNEELVAKLKGSKPLISRLKGFTELNVDFVAIETRVFTYGTSITDGISNLYLSEQQGDLKNELILEARKLVSVCLTLQEMPYIRYYSKSALSRDFARYVETEMKQALQKLSTWKPSDKRERGTLLIVDRSLDPLAPLMHEYTFQAMVNDLLDIDGELVVIPDPEKDKKYDEKGKPGPDKKDAKEDAVVLSEDDNLWVEYRHSHIGNVITDVSRKFREFKAGSAAVHYQQKDKETVQVKEMMAAMKDMPTYQATMKKYAKHMSLATECMNKFTKSKLKDLGEFEQDMATGLDSDGKKVAGKNLKGTLVQMCQNKDISNLDKLRLLMIYLISQGGIQESTRKELMKSIHPKLQRAVLNLSKLGVDLSQAFQGGKSKHSAARMKEFEKRIETIPLQLMRYIPLLHSVVNELISFDLSETDYPYTTAPPSEDGGKRKSTVSGKSARTKTKWRQGGKDKPVDEKEDGRPRYIVFVVGGVTFSETRSIYEIAAEHKQANLVIGSSGSLIASEFIRGLSGKEITPQNFKQLLASEGLGGKDGDDDDES